eukprot:s4493_g5.t1
MPNHRRHAFATIPTGYVGRMVARLTEPQAPSNPFCTPFWHTAGIQTGLQPELTEFSEVALGSVDLPLTSGRQGRWSVLAHRPTRLLNRPPSQAELCIMSEWSAAFRQGAGSLQGARSNESV